MNTKMNTSLVKDPPVWLSTGCSTGLGLELAKQAIDRGYRTVMTAREPAQLQGYGATDNVPVRKLDVTQPDQVAATIQAAEARFGGIGYFAAIDAALAKLDELRTQFMAGEAAARAADFPKPKKGALA
jgi:NAD(P)-dependent dehydrogenase (short-subunit alcohol dehydrogenase family)